MSARDGDDAAVVTGFGPDDVGHVVRSVDLGEHPVVESGVGSPDPARTERTRAVAASTRSRMACTSGRRAAPAGLSATVHRSRTPTITRVVLEPAARKVAGSAADAQSDDIELSRVPDGPSGQVSILREAFDEYASPLVCPDGTVTRSVRRRRKDIRSARGVW
ncbi:hypothetical protein [Actinophytocola gossypii]|uniref:hypothetical protein n=1 Tax=Actinophytocola gossypii TaxID=2812003 RepID=UPI0021A8AA4F|nr:hypothetical protein [Actinophytocola gossypii]